MRAEKYLLSLLTVLVFFPTFSCSTFYYKFLTEDYAPVNDINESLVALYLNSPAPIDYSFISSFCTITPKFSTAFFKYFLSKLFEGRISPVLATFLASFSRKLFSEEAYSYYEGKEIMRLAISYGITHNLTCKELDPFVVEYYTYSFESYIDDVCNNRRKPYEVLNGIERLIFISGNNTLVYVENSNLDLKKEFFEGHRSISVSKEECKKAVESVLFSLPACFPGSNRLKAEIASEVCNLNLSKSELNKLLRKLSLTFTECEPFKITFNNSELILLTANSSGYFFIDLNRKDIIYYPPKYSQHINKIFEEKAKKYLKFGYQKKGRKTTKTFKEKFWHSSRKIRGYDKDGKLSATAVLLVILAIIFLTRRENGND